MEATLLVNSHEMLPTRASLTQRRGYMLTRLLSKRGLILAILSVALNSSALAVLASRTASSCFCSNRASSPVHRGSHTISLTQTLVALSLGSVLPERMLCLSSVPRRGAPVGQRLAALLSGCASCRLQLPWQLPCSPAPWKVHESVLPSIPHANCNDRLRAVPAQRTACHCWLPGVDCAS